MSDSYYERAKTWIDTGDYDLGTLNTTIEKFSYQLKDNNPQNIERKQDLTNTIEFLNSVAKEISGERFYEKESTASKNVNVFKQDQPKLDTSPLIPISTGDVKALCPEEKLAALSSILSHPGISRGISTINTIH
jgi:hypothetical protein